VHPANPPRSVGKSAALPEYLTHAGAAVAAGGMPASNLRQSLSRQATRDGFTVKVRVAQLLMPFHSQWSQQLCEKTGFILFASFLEACARSCSRRPAMSPKLTHGRINWQQGRRTCRRPPALSELIHQAIAQFDHCRVGIRFPSFGVPIDQVASNTSRFSPRRTTPGIHQSRYFAAIVGWAVVRENSPRRKHGPGRRGEAKRQMPNCVSQPENL